MQRQQRKTSTNTKNQGNVMPVKDHNNLLVTDPKDMQICDLPDKKAVLRKLKKLQENTER